MLGGETQSRSRVHPSRGPEDLLNMSCGWACREVDLLPQLRLPWEISFPLWTPGGTSGIPFLLPLKFSSFNGVLKKEEIQMFQESLL